MELQLMSDFKCFPLLFSLPTSGWARLKRTDLKFPGVVPFLKKKKNPICFLGLREST